MFILPILTYFNERHILLIRFVHFKTYVCLSATLLLLKPVLLRGKKVTKFLKIRGLRAKMRKPVFRPVSIAF